ncbi:MAG: bifunctional ornithine acetyltransferase/N-acetylglutamate synthase, partial [Oscillospiraceae bacterium]
HNLAQAIICNSGNANTCNADGFHIATQMCREVANQLNIYENDILIASTGVIGQPLPLKPITDAMPQLVNSLSDDEKASDDAAHAIMTTDTVKKEISIEFKIGDTI